MKLDCSKCTPENLNNVDSDLFKVVSYGLTGAQYYVDFKCLQKKDGCTESVPVKKSKLKQWLTNDEYKRLEY